MTAEYIRGGRCAVRPYLFARADAEAFVCNVFGAGIIARHETPSGAHLEVSIGDSILVMECGDSFPAGVETTQASVYVYIEDVDQAYERALAAGATSIAPPEDKPYEERQFGVKDPSGNTWWVSRYTG